MASRKATHGRTRRDRRSPSHHGLRSGARLVPSRAVHLWADIQPGPYGVLFPGSSSSSGAGLKSDQEVLEAIAARFLFPSLDLTWSLAPEALSTLVAETDLVRVAAVFGRATRAFIDVELDPIDTTCTVEAAGCRIEARSLQVLGLYPSAATGEEEQPSGAVIAAELTAGLVPLLVPLAGPLGALVKGAGVLFRSALGASRRFRLLQVAYQRDEHAFGWCFARGDGKAVIDGVHRGTALLAVARASAEQPGAILAGRLRIAVDLDGTAENVFLERRFAVDLAPYAARAVQKALLERDHGPWSPT